MMNGERKVRREENSFDLKCRSNIHLFGPSLRCFTIRLKGAGAPAKSSHVDEVWPRSTVWDWNVASSSSFFLPGCSFSS